MDLLRHLLTLVVLAVVLRWLWNSSTTEQAKLEAGRQLFPPTRAIRIVILSCGVVFTCSSGLSFPCVNRMSGGYPAFFWDFSL